MLQLIPTYNGHAKHQEGVFILPKVVFMDKSFPIVNRVFEKRLERLGDYKVEKGNDPVITYKKEMLGEEGYRLDIRDDKVLIYAENEAGYSNGLVSLYQLLAKGNGKISSCVINDSPKYVKRGMMLDVCRHFFPVEEIKLILEQCALLKLNHFHWSLSNDQGFRVESRVFPQLNKISSYRKLAAKDPVVLEGLAEPDVIYGGYYTQEEIKDVVEFATQRQIEIIPEINLPGHSTAILAAFPGFTCSGEELEVANTFGIHSRIFCAGKEEGYEFLYDLLDEMCELFPSKYFHIGGDEAPKSEWKTCKSCIGIVEEEGFKNYEQLQAYFTEKLVLHLKEKNKIPIVWNEAAASGELNESAVIQYWIEMAPGKSYVVPEIEKGRKFILSSMNHFYCDYSYAEIPLKATLLYEPELKGTPLADKNVLGIEAPMWTEWTPTNESIEKMIYPRMLALAECAWTKERDYESFIDRLKKYIDVEALNLLKGMPLEEATIHGQEALDMIVKNVMELSARYGHMEKEGGGKAEAVIPDGAEEIDPSEMANDFIRNKMKAAYSEEEIRQVQEKLGQIMMGK